MGLSEQLFEETPEPELRCPICWDVLDDPVLACRNDHTYCRTCIDGSAVCPVCKEPVSAQKRANIAVANSLAERILRCPNAGCEWSGPVSYIDQHVTICPYILDRCMRCRSQFTQGSHCVNSCQFPLASVQWNPVDSNTSSLKTGKIFVQLGLRWRVRILASGAVCLELIDTLATHPIPVNIYTHKMNRQRDLAFWGGVSTHPCTFSVAQPSWSWEMSWRDDRNFITLDIQVERPAAAATRVAAQ